MYSSLHHVARRAIEAANDVIQSGEGPKKIDIPPWAALALSLTFLLLAAVVLAVRPSPEKRILL